MQGVIRAEWLDLGADAAVHTGGCASRRERDLYFWWDNVGNEVDLLIDGPHGLRALEIKLGRTFASDGFDGPEKYKKRCGL